MAERSASLAGWLWAAILLHFALLFMVGVSRHWGYMSSVNDLGAFDQVVWNTLHGNFLHNTTINPFAASINWLGCHFQPIFLPSAGGWDFHPITLGVPFIALGLWAVVIKRARMLIFSCLPMLTVHHFLLPRC